MDFVVLDHATSQRLVPPTVKPSARALPLWLNLTRFVRNPLRALPRAVYDQPIVTYGRKRPLVAWVTGPELIEQVLVKRSDIFSKTRLDKRVLRPLIGNGLLTADGDQWRWQRRLASPLFRPADALTYVPAMTQAARDQVSRWRDAGPGHVANLEIDMAETTFAVIARTILLGVTPEESVDIQRTGYGYVRPIMWSVASALMLTPESWWYPGKASMMRAARANREIVRGVLARRRASGAEGDDLIARMLRARHPDTDRPMTEDELIDNLGTFLLAGHETTAKALTWTLYLLARSQEWQDRAREEVLRVAGGRDVRAEDVAKLEITQRILKEGMRLYPPVPAMTRVCTKPTELGGVAFPEPTLIVIPIYAVHRHRALWDDPDAFDPDRFLPEREAEILRTQFMPFGAGPRVCIGAAFAMTEATVVLASLLKSVRFSCDDDLKPEPISRVTLHPRGGIRLGVTMLDPS